MKIVLLGSKSAKEKKVQLKKELQELGHEAIIHPFFEKLVAGEMPELAEMIEKEHYVAKKEYGFIQWYYDKILKSDAVLVVNIDKGEIKNYIGGNTFLEMGFAYVLGKKIFLMNNIPDIIFYKDEIMAMDPTVINGNLEMIK